VAVRGTLVFDGACGFCTRTVGWLRRLDRRGRVALIPFQRPGVLASTGLSPAQAAASVWWIGDDGRRASGAAAANLALSAALGVRLPMLLYRLTRRLQERVYRWVAVNRHRLRGVKPHCRQHPEDCAA
jgi:predicted DCC family thiol-disulfide oxidoreductase YuxK